METPTPTRLRRPVVRRYRNRSLDVTTGALVLVLFVRAAGKREFALRDLGGGVYELDLRQGEEALLYCGDRVPEPTVEPLPAQDGRCNRYGLPK